MGISYLIDTHVLLWWLFDDDRLCSISRNIIKNPDNMIIISSISAWEIATKHRIGKLPEAEMLLKDDDRLLDTMRFTSFFITPAHALKAGSLPIAHRDPSRL